MITSSTTMILLSVLLRLLSFCFVEMAWTEKLDSAFGWGYLDLSDEDSLPATGFKNSDYFVANILYSVADPITVGAELQYGKLKTVGSGTANNTRLQFSVIYNF